MALEPRDPAVVKESWQSQSVGPGWITIWRPASKGGWIFTTQTPARGNWASRRERLRELLRQLLRSDLGLIPSACG